MAPFSDIDILFLTDDDTDFSSVMAELWDTVREPSIIVRHQNDLKNSAKEDLLFSTTILDARWLQGPRSEELETAHQWMHDIRPHFDEDLSKEAASRHKAQPGAGHQEPNIREGQGGLRDLQIHRWLEKTGFVPNNIRPSQSENLTLHYNVFVAGRAIIHMTSERKENRLLLDEAGARFDWLRWKNPDLFAKSICLSLKNAAFEFPTSRSNPDQQFDDIKHASKDELVKMIQSSFSRSNDSSFSKLIRNIDKARRLGEMLPAWDHIDCLVRNDAAHSYTPDEHTHRVIENIETFSKNPASILDFSDETRWGLVLLAALFHDVGKGLSSDHSIEGASIARDTLRDWGYSEDDIETVVFLVKNHLLLTYNAFHRDVDDPSLIHMLAKQIGDISRLRKLYALTTSDVRAVAPELFSDWKSNLLSLLTIRLARQCESNLTTENIEKAVIKKRGAAVIKVLNDDSPSDTQHVHKHFTDLDARYAMAHQPERIAEHIEWISELNTIQSKIVKHDFLDVGVSEISVVTPARRGLFGDIAGTIASRSLNILEANIFTNADGIALDTFKVTDLNGNVVDEDRWKSLQIELHDVIHEKIRAEDLINSRIRYASPEPESNGPPVVEFDNESSQTHTIIDISPTDKMGLLYRIAAIFRDCNISITSAIVSTSAGRADDVFYVTVDSGEKIVDTAVMAAIRDQLATIAD
ncbi:MAG: HD domain-containing protein [Candidatus Lindowbacteria bacterium]|nr:HD domain-containing protein [Candidatus Lindowbacteria bacterium]